MGCFGCENYVEIIDFVDGIGVTKKICKLHKMRLLEIEVMKGCKDYGREKSAKRKKTQQED